MAGDEIQVALPAATVEAARAIAEAVGTSVGELAARGLRNEVLRRQLAADPLAEDDEWLDFAEEAEEDLRR
ncbi:hypothetical protein [Actinomadura rubrisoli]|uniref:Uncharacterized protein n=1 Tax=Actinomadura rubrisoli TaxID=2530368 RepID=A0A4V6PFA7_9ACTN|nr:hypothetical protein [Actinomadura rubrisoli]TDD97707.1 hypothetical protein E1298_01335 [Actinomadura rubrisoli]